MSNAGIPLLNTDHEEEALDRKENGTPDRFAHRARICVQVITAAFLVLLSTFFILYLQWHSVFITLRTKFIQPPNSVEPWTPERDLKVELHPENHLSRDPTTRYYSWNITKAKIAPDGVEKEVFLVNNQFPGPLIEARTGDTLVIDVFNYAEEGVSLHWHGLHMRGANHMDGPVGITQCAIQPGGNFTYQVPINDQDGTFWYHAHSEVQRGDGLYGGLVVHKPVYPAESDTYQYNKELLFLIGDWYHSPSSEILSRFMSRTSNGIESCPDSLLINGQGYFDCSMATDGSPVNCSTIEKPSLSLNKQYAYRIRVVNVGSLTGFSITVPDSQMDVIQVDGGGPVVSYPSNSVGVLYPGERVDFTLAWDGSVVETDTVIKIDLDNEYFLRPNFALTPSQSFLIATEYSPRSQNNRTPDIIQFNLRDAKGPPLDASLPEAQKKFMIYTAIEILSHQNLIPKGFINRTTWEPQELPLVAVERESWGAHQLVPWTGPGPVWIELTIKNVDGTGHPFHLHGFDFLFFMISGNADIRPNQRIRTLIDGGEMLGGRVVFESPGN